MRSGDSLRRDVLRMALNAAYNQDPNEKAALFRIAGEMVDASSVDELVSRVEGKDTIARTHIIALLARFDLPKVHAALQRTLNDPNKLVRGAALRAIVSLPSTRVTSSSTESMSTSSPAILNRAAFSFGSCW